MCAGTYLRVVSMGCVDISSVAPDITAHALNRLNIARLCNTSITTQQLEAIFRSDVGKLDTLNGSISNSCKFEK